MRKGLKQRLARVRLVAFDVDGTLTDGTIWLGAKEELKGFNIADGFGIRLLIEAGIEVAFITGRRSASVARRAKELGVKHCYQGVRDKRACLERLAAKLKITRDEIAAMGDDIPDFELFAAAGVKLCVANAASEILTAADWTSTREGGRGAAREAAELVLGAQGRRAAAIRRFTNCAKS